MAEKTENTEGNAQSDTGVVVNVLTQHAKDISFENHATSESIGEEGMEPEISVSFDMKPERVGEDIFGLISHIEIESKNKKTDKKLFTIDLQYFISLRFTNLPEDQMLPVLVIEGGRLSFPAIRNIVRDLTVEGGFAPFNLQPIDFVALYREQMERIQQSNGAAAPNGVKGESAPPKKSSKAKKN